MMSAAALRLELEDLERQDAAAASSTVEIKHKTAAGDEDWSADFEGFLSQQWEAKQLRKHLLAGAIDFLQRNADVPLVKRIEFLKYKGFSTLEMGEVFNVAGQWEEWKTSQLKSICHTIPPVMPVMTPDSVTTSLTPSTPFRIGMHVYAYLDLDRYFPAVITKVDESRHGDILQATFEFCSSHRSIFQKSVWLVAGFKGVVADIIPIPEAFSEGQAVIFIPDGAQEDIMYDAIVHRIRPDGLFEMEYYTDKGEARATVPIESLRTLDHPYLIADAAEAMAERRRREEEIRRKQFFSSQTFPIQGVKERQPVRHGQGSVPISQEERRHLGVALSSFKNYPMLYDQKPLSSMHTFDYFIGVYCKVEGSHAWWAKGAVQGIGQGFGFNLSHLERHPRCPHLLLHNPILEVASQCLDRKSQFVDPDFPPMGHSIYRSPVDYNVPTSSSVMEPMPTGCPETFEWRRASEMLSSPKPVDGRYPLIAGTLSRDWMTQVFSLWPESLEFDESISPSLETSFFGAYTIKLFIDGRPYFVLVDDFLPVHSKGLTPAYMQSHNPNEIWPALLEKVYAKLRGSYQALSQPNLSWGPEAMFADLTGGLVQVDHYALLLDKETWFDNLLRRLEEPSKCGLLSTVRKDRKQVKKSVLPTRDKGLRLALGECHRVLAMKELCAEPSGVRRAVVLIEHPWSTVQMEPAERAVFFHHWPDPLIKAVEELQRNEEGRPGRHWVPFNDYMDAFSTSIACYFFHSWQRGMMRSSFAGRCGGSKWDHSNAKWLSNPQLFISLSSHGTLVAELRLLDRRLHSAPIDVRVMQLSLMTAVSGREPLASADSWIMTSNAIDFEDEYHSACPSVHLSTELAGGKYILIPEVGTFSCTEEFVIHIWSDVPFNGQLLDPLDCPTPIATA